MTEEKFWFLLNMVGILAAFAVFIYAFLFGSLMFFVAMWLIKWTWLLSVDRIIKGKKLE